jgi:hypothetical protein
MRKVIRTACLMAIIGVSPQAQAMEHIQQFVPEAQQVGQGRLTYLFWDLYDASLYAPEGRWETGSPFALQLMYLTDIEGSRIADRSVEEIRAQGFTDEVKLATWHAQMQEIFPDVYEGATLTGVYTGTGESIFYKDNEELGRIADPDFSKRFFGIWLNETTSAPDLRKQLLGLT